MKPSESTTHSTSHELPRGSAHLLRIALACVISLAVCLPSSGQFRYLGGSLSGQGLFSATRTGDPQIDGSTADFGGSFGLNGAGYLADPSIASINFQFSARQTTHGNTYAFGGGRSWDRSLDWYAIDADLLSFTGLGLSLGSALTESDVKQPNSNLSATTNAQVFKGFTRSNHGTMRLGLGGLGWITAAGALNQSWYQGLVTSPTVLGRQMSVTYGQNGEEADGFSATYAYSDNKSPDIGVVNQMHWTNLMYNKTYDQGSLYVSGDHRVDAFGRETHLSGTGQVDVDSVWRSSTGARVDVYGQGAYIRSIALAQQAMYFVTRTGLSGSISANGGYSASYSTQHSTMPEWTSNPTGGAQAGGTYVQYFDSLKTTQASVSAQTSADYVSLNAAPQTQAVLSGAYQQRFTRETMASASVTASKLFVRDGPVTLIQSALLSSRLEYLTYTLNASHSNQFVSQTTSTGRQQLVLDDFNASQTIGGVIPKTDIQLTAFGTERWERWQLQSVQLQASLAFPTVEDLASSASYALFLDNIGGIKTHRVSANLAYQFRAVKLTGQGSWLHTSGLTYFEGYIILSRPFSIL